MARARKKAKIATPTSQLSYLEALPIDILIEIILFVTASVRAFHALAQVSRTLNGALHPSDSTKSLSIEETVYKASIARKYPYFDISKLNIDSSYKVKYRIIADNMFEKRIVKLSEPNKNLWKSMRFNSQDANIFLKTFDLSTPFLEEKIDFLILKMVTVFTADKFGQNAFQYMKTLGLTTLLHKIHQQITHQLATSVADSIFRNISGEPVIWDILCDQRDQLKIKIMKDPTLLEKKFSIFGRRHTLLSLAVTQANPDITALLLPYFKGSNNLYETLDKQSISIVFDPSTPAINDLRDFFYKNPSINAMIVNQSKTKKHTLLHDVASVPNNALILWQLQNFFKENNAYDAAQFEAWVNQIDIGDQSSFHTAIKIHDLDMIQFLLNAGADTQKKVLDLTTLQLAISSCKVKIVQQLVRFGTPVAQSDITYAIKAKETKIEKNAKRLDRIIQTLKSNSFFSNKTASESKNSVTQNMQPPQ